jgi:ADP-ribose pyrophosphatase YjhB (NUDIX family)
MTVEVGHIIRELSSYLNEHPAEKVALMPLYDAARDHVQRRLCNHEGRCPVVTTGAVVVDEGGRVLSLRHADGFALAEAEPEAHDESLSGAALRILAEELGVRDVWTEPGLEGPFLVDVTPPGRHRYGPRHRFGFRYLFRAHSGAVFPSMIETGAAAWMPPAHIGINSVRQRLRDSDVDAS